MLYTVEFRDGGGRLKFEARKIRDDQAQAVEEFTDVREHQRPP